MSLESVITGHPQITHRHVALWLGVLSLGISIIMASGYFYWVGQQKIQSETKIPEQTEVTAPTPALPVIQVKLTVSGSNIEVKLLNPPARPLSGVAMSFVKTSPAQPDTSQFNSNNKFVLNPQLKQQGWLININQANPDNMPPTHDLAMLHISPEGGLLPADTAILSWPLDGFNTNVEQLRLNPEFSHLVTKDGSVYQLQLVDNKDQP